MLSAAVAGCALLAGRARWEQAPAQTGAARFGTRRDCGRRGRVGSAPAFDRPDGRHAGRADARPPPGRPRPGPAETPGEWMPCCDG
ncbi:hypothetical protein HBB16_18780 [Pseudonocardia sp. MCCB 268]|nr:hypothetical protein [Pseudonocardia cytotoxica]